MIQIVGTIRDTVNLAKLDSQWQQKKNTLGRKNKNQELTPQERMLKQYQEELAQMRKSNETSAIYNKLKAGAKLSPEEIAYLRKNNPQALKEYEEILQEREAYRRQLRNCKTKEEAEQLKINKMNGFLAQAKTISSNPNIPKGEKLAQMEKLMRRLAGIEDEHIEFTKTVQYREMPDKAEAEKSESTEEVEVLDEENVKATDMEGAEIPNGESIEEPDEESVEVQKKESTEASDKEGLAVTSYKEAVNEIRKVMQGIDEAKKHAGVDVSI